MLSRFPQGRSFQTTVRWILSLLTYERAVATVTLALIATVWLVTARSVAVDRTAAIDAAYRETERSAEQLAKHTADVLDDSKDMLRLVKYLVERDGNVDLMTLNKAGLLGDVKDFSVALVDAKGNLVTSNQMARKPLNFADRDWFRASRERSGPIATPPIFGRILNRWTIPTSIQVVDRQGAFAGAVLVAFNAESLAGGFRHDDDPETVVGVYGRDGIYRSRWLGRNFTSGQTIPPARMEEILARKLDRTDALVSALDGVRRYPSNVAVPNSDLMAVVSISEEHAMATHTGMVRRALAIAALTTLVIGLVGWLLGRKVRSERLHASRRHRAEAMQLATLDAIPAQIVLLDGMARIASASAGWNANPRVVAVSDDGDWIGRSFYDARQRAFGGAPTDTALLEDGVGAVVGGRSSRFVHEYESHPGSAPVWLRLAATPFMLDNEPVAVVTQFDITPRKLAEQSLERSRRLGSIVSQVARIGGWSFNVADKRLALSQELADMLELEALDAITFADIRALHGRVRSSLLQHLRQCMRAGKAFDFETEVTNRSGRRFWARHIGHPLHDESGRVVEVHGAMQDISEAKRAEIELQNSRARLDTALEGMSDGFCIVDDEWNFVYANRQMGWMLDQSADALTGTTLWQGLPRLGGTPVESQLHDARQAHRSIKSDEFETRIGAWCQATAHPFEGGLAIYFIDTTESRLANMQLQLMETCLSSMNEMVVVTEASPIGMPGPRIVYVNDACLLTTGYSRAEMLGNTPRMLQGERTQRAELDRIATALEKAEAVHAELLNYRKNGECYSLEIDVAPVFDDAGRVSHFLSVQRDITQRKADQAKLENYSKSLEATVATRTAQLAFTNSALRTREEEISSVIEHMADGVISFNREGTVRAANSTAEVLLGVSKGELIGADIHDFISGMDIGSIGKDFTRGGDGTVAWWGEHRSGERIPLDVACSEFQVNDQRWYTAIVRDIRERLRIMADIRAAQLAAEQASKVKSLFVANMSHEIRTPMNGVIGMIDLLRDTPMQAAQREMLEIAGESANALMHVVEDVLDFSKIEAGKLELNIGPTALLDVADRCCSLAQSLDRKGRLTLQLFVDPRTPDEVETDAARLRQVLLILLSNAVKFSTADGHAGRVELRVALVADTVAGPEAGDDIVVDFSVRDNGIGMDSDTIARLFTPFTQAEASTTSAFGGTGLGLAIARQLTRLMGGDITIDSKLGEGSTFTVRLSFKPLASTRKERPAATVGKLGVVLLGGEPAVRADIAACLQDHVEPTPSALAMNPTTDAASAVRPAHGAALVVWIADAEADGGADATLDGALARCRSEVPAGLPLIVVHPKALARPTRTAPGIVTLRSDRMTRPVWSAAAALAFDDTPVDPAGDGPASTWGTLQGPAPREHSRPILVAEDNDVNQRVLQAQLGRLGYTGVFCTNGRLALEAWATGDYALLLTDIRMPAMDGFELTRLIRQAECAGPRMPIVALTANALKEEAEHCRAAGMDDYATKPIKLENLRLLLDKWLKTAAHAPHDPSPRSAGAGDARPGATAIDIAVLRMMVGDDSDAIEELLVRFRASAGELQARAIEARSRADWASLNDIAHQLKSSARTFGAEALGDICARLEVATAQDAAGDSDDLMVRLHAELARVSEAAAMS